MLFKIIIQIIGLIIIQITKIVHIIIKKKNNNNNNIIKLKPWLFLLYSIFLLLPSHLLTSSTRNSGLLYF